MVSQGNILLADDEETYLDATGDLLKAEGFDCHKVKNSGDMAQAMCAEVFDLLITDLNMPGRHVLEMIDEIPQQSKGIPVVVVTGYPSIPSAIESVRLNVLEYIIKPVQFPTLLEVVKRGVKQTRVLRSVQKIKRQAEERLARLSELEIALCAGHGSLRDVTAVESLWVDPGLTGLQRQLDDLSQFVVANHPVPTSHHQDSYQLREGLYEAIQVLHRTKSAFKSKDLASLRLRLETLLQETSLQQDSKDSHLSDR